MAPAAARRHQRIADSADLWMTITDMAIGLHAERSQGDPVLLDGLTPEQAADGGATTGRRRAELELS